VTRRTARSRRLVIGATFLAVLVVGAAGWLLGWSSFLTVKQIVVIGLSADSPLKSQGVISLSGVKIGEPMARVSGASIKRELSQVPRIGSVALKRSWPHKVVLVIKERVPVAGVVKGNQFALIDSQGNVYGTVPAPPAGLPVIAVTGDFQTGLKTAMSVITYLPEGIKSQVTHLDSTGTDGLQLTLSSGARVIWGSSEDLALKSRVLSTLLAGAGAERVKVFDVSAPYAPTTK
jgi:cell division protein FtsQ